MPKKILDNKFISALFKKPIEETILSSHQDLQMDTEMYGLLLRWLDFSSAIAAFLIVFFWMTIGYMGLGYILAALFSIIFGFFELFTFIYIQEEFTKALEISRTINFTQKGLVINIYGGGDSYTVARTPFSLLYLRYVIKSFAE